MNMMMNARQAFCRHLLGNPDISSKQALQNILSNKPINLIELKKLTLKINLPSNYRPLVWKLLLGITPRFAESQEFIHQHHTLIFEDLFQALKALRLGVPISHQNSNYTQTGASASTVRLYRNGRNGHLSEIKNPEPEHFFLMWLISEAQLSRYPENQLNANENQKYILLGHRLRTGSIFEDHIDLFHVCSSLWSLLKNNEANLKEAVQNAFGLLRKENNNLHRHLCRVGLFSSSLIDDHCSSLFCEFLTDSAIETIIDKLFAGSFYILTCIIVALLCQISNELFRANSVENVRNDLYQIRKEQADSVLMGALDIYYRERIEI